MLPSLGAPELLLVLVIVLLIFGPGKLPSIGAALGKGVREFQRGADGPSLETESKAELAAPTDRGHKPV